MKSLNYVTRIVKSLFLLLMLANVPCICNASEFTNTSLEKKEKKERIKKRKKDKHKTISAKDENVPVKDENVPDVVKILPEFPGGDVELMKYLFRNVKYPREAYNRGITGKVVVNFKIQKDGEITDVRVLEKAHRLLDAEAIRVIKAMPKWKPGEVDGEKVVVEYHVPISFNQK